MDIRFPSISSFCLIAASSKLPCRWAVLAILVMACGCSGRPSPVPISGVVTLDGQPVANAGVLFCPIAEGPVASGATDAKGNFKMATLNKSGVLPGKYGVAIIKKEFAGNGGAGILGTPQPNRIKWIVPEKFSTPETSGLLAEVNSSSREFNFAISSR